MAKYDNSLLIRGTLVQIVNPYPINNNKYELVGFESIKNIYLTLENVIHLIGEVSVTPNESWAVVSVYLFAFKNEYAMYRDEIRVLTSCSSQNELNK